MKKNKAREQLIEMYISALKEDVIPWQVRWHNAIPKNGITNVHYKGANRLLLSYVAYKEKYEDSRWLTYLQIKQNGYHLKEAKGKGIPIEYWAVYDIENKTSIDFSEYEKIVLSNPEKSGNYKLFCQTSYVFNGTFIEGLPMEEKSYNSNINLNSYISKLIKNLGVKYSEYGNRAYYQRITDEIVLPSKEKFIDSYSYYATQLHEICHSTGHTNRLNRTFGIKGTEEYAREELIAEISSSFLMQNLNIDVEARHYDNHKAYIQSWISILENKPNELFKAITESNRVCDYIESHNKIRKRDYMR